MNKAGKICIWGALVIALLFAFAALVASPIAKHILHTQVKELIGRDLHAQSVRVNLYTGGVTIKDFHCKEPNGETDFVSFERLYVRIAYPRLMGKTVKLKRIHLEGFSGQVMQSGSKWNFSDIIKRFAPPAGTPADTMPSEWTVILKDIRLSNSSIRYRDVLHDKQWQIDNINLSMPGLAFDRKDQNAGLDFVVPAGGKVTVEAGYAAPTNSLTVHLNLDDVNTDVLLPLIQDYVNVSTLGATLNGKLRLRANMDNIQNIDAKGKLVMQHVRIKDHAKNDVAALEEMSMVMNRLDLSTNTFILDSLVLNGLTGNYEVHKNWNTISRLVKGQNDDKAKKRKSRYKSGKNKQNSKPLVWLAKEAVLTAHEMTYYDYSMKRNWRYTVKSLKAEGHNVSSKGRNVIKVNATMTGDAKLKMDFVGSLNVKKHDTQFNLTLTNVNLKDFDAPCRNYTGYPILSGMMHVDSHMEFVRGQLTGNTKIVIDNHEIGPREEMTKAPYRNIPVRSTFRRLADSDNRIIINAPVKGNATKKKFSLAKLVTKSLIKETFGRMHATRSRKDKISKEEQKEIQRILNEDDDD